MQTMKLCFEEGEALCSLKSPMKFKKKAFKGSQLLEWEWDSVAIINKAEVTLNQQYCFQNGKIPFMWSYGKCYLFYEDVNVFY